MEVSSYLGKYKFDSQNVRIFPKQSSIPPFTEMKIFLLGKLTKKADLEGKTDFDKFGRNGPSGHHRKSIFQKTLSKKI